MMYARVLTFHTDIDHMPAVITALDEALARFRRTPGFKGLLCLEHDGFREQVVIITLWDATGLAATAGEAEEARELIADATDIGVTSRSYEVLGFVPGAGVIEEVALSHARALAGVPA